VGLEKVFGVIDTFVVSSDCLELIIGHFQTQPFCAMSYGYRVDHDVHWRWLDFYKEAALWLTSKIRMEVVTSYPQSYISFYHRRFFSS
jgi:hypothetical protein